MTSYKAQGPIHPNHGWSMNELPNYSNWIQHILTDVSRLVTWFMLSFSFVGLRWEFPLELCQLRLSRTIRWIAVFTAPRPSTPPDASAVWLLAGNVSCARKYDIPFVDTSSYTAVMQTQHLSAEESKYTCAAALSWISCWINERDEFDEYDAEFRLGTELRYLNNCLWNGNALKQLGKIGIDFDTIVPDAGLCQAFTGAFWSYLTNSMCIYIYIYI